MLNSASGALSEARLVELEQAATHLANNPPRRCRCGGTCPTCAAHRAASRLVGPVTLLELAREIRRLRSVMAENTGSRW